MPGCSTPSTAPSNPGQHYARHINEAIRVCNSATLGAIRAGVVRTTIEAELFRWQCLTDNKATL